MEYFPHSLAWSGKSSALSNAEKFYVIKYSPIIFLFAARLEEARGRGGAAGPCLLPPLSISISDVCSLL